MLPNAGFSSFLVTWEEVAVGVGLLLGILSGIAAGFGVLMNLNYLLAGTLSVNRVLLGLPSGPWFARSSREADWPRPSAREPSALEILRQRYAGGEIDMATFEHRRKRLEAYRECKQPPT